MDSNDVMWIVLGFSMSMLGLMYVANPQVFQFVLAVVVITLPFIPWLTK